MSTEVLPEFRNKPEPPPPFVDAGQIESELLKTNPIGRDGFACLPNEEERAVTLTIRKINDLTTEHSHYEFELSETLRSERLLDALSDFFEDKYEAIKHARAGAATDRRSGQSLRRSSPAA